VTEELKEHLYNVALVDQHVKWLLMKKIILGSLLFLGLSPASFGDYQDEINALTVRWQELSGGDTGLSDMDSKA